MKADTKALMDRLLADDTILRAKEGRATADPTDPTSTLRATFALMKAKDYATGQTLLRWALEFEPDNSRLLRRMTDVTLLKGERDAARRWAEMAIAADPADVDNHDNLAKLLIWVGDFAAAEPAAARAVALAPLNAEMTRRLGDIRTRLKQERGSF